MKRAVSHGDVGFLWKLLREVPAAQATAGDLERSETDIMRVFGLVTDFVGAGEGELGEALRPVYLEYLATHPDS
ncbi:MAG: hypothetical protein ABIS86_00915 [Streptosporangiaceae bacterium]